MSVYREEANIGGTTISLETGSWAKQAHGSIVYRAGNLVLLATVCAEKEAKSGQDFFPLTVEYREKNYAVGRFPGGFIKRESRPQEQETLISRLIDRPIRPLFPEGYLAEVQLIVTVLSADPKTVVEGHAISAASAALSVSDVPFSGPIAGVMVARIDGNLVADPDADALKKSDLELVVAGSQHAIMMIEGGAQEFSNEEILAALEFAHSEIRKRIELQNKIVKSVGVVKREAKLRLPDPVLKERTRKAALQAMTLASQNANKAEREKAVSAVYEKVSADLKAELEKEGLEDIDAALKEIGENLHAVEADVVRNLIFEKQVRADGRKLDEIRPISVELDVLPGVHGSAVFTRGQTQSLGVVTLGTTTDAQQFENFQGVHQKTFMLHYNFPPFSTGEVKRIGTPGRREIGHGNLAERALKYVVPAQTSFPYVIRVVSEILESNGSSSMASVCSGSLAMMAAGVPVGRPVAGIAMGLIVGESGKYAILSDIAGLEDHFGDMDFKVAGTDKGITAFQLDIKVEGISIDIMRKALEQAERGRMHILRIMNQSIAEARTSVSAKAPRITTMQIDSGRIGELIGPGGKIIRAIIEKSGAELNVDDSGTVTIAAMSSESAEMATKMINAIFAEVETGTIYDGVVKKIADFGAFVEILPGKEGLLHISKMDVHRVHSVRDLFKEGDPVQVMVIGVDKQGRIDLSRKELLNPTKDGEEKSDQPRPEQRPHGHREGSHREHGGRHHRERDRHRSR